MLEQDLAIGGVSVCLSVCLSVTRWQRVKTNELIEIIRLAERL